MKHLVVRFGGSGRPHDVARMAAQHSRQPRPRIVQGAVRPAAHAMRAGGIAYEFLRRVQPCLPRGGMQRSRGVVVEISHMAFVLQNTARTFTGPSSVPGSMGTQASMGLRRRVDEFFINALAKVSRPDVILTRAT